MNRRQKDVYAALTKAPPAREGLGWGSAYWHGYRNPDIPVDQAGPVVGLPGSEARAAYMAGRDAARRGAKRAPSDAHVDGVDMSAASCPKAGGEST